MQALTEEALKAAFVNANDEDLRLLNVPTDFPWAEWDHTDFYAWRDPRTRGRGYIVAEVGGEPRAVVLRAAEGNSRAHSALCNICHLMQPADAVSLFTARKAGGNADSIGTYICADLSCHENVRLAPPLTQNEVRPNVDAQIDGARRRAESLVQKVWNG